MTPSKKLNETSPTTAAHFVTWCFPPIRITFSGFLWSFFTWRLQPFIVAIFFMRFLAIKVQNHIKFCHFIELLSCDFFKITLIMFRVMFFPSVPSPFKILCTLLWYPPTMFVSLKHLDNHFMVIPKFQSFTQLLRIS